MVTVSLSTKTRCFRRELLSYSQKVTKSHFFCQNFDHITPLPLDLPSSLGVSFPDGSGEFFMTFLVISNCRKTRQ